MTEPGGATGVGGIIGYLQLNREDWIRGVRESERDADRLGRLNPDIRISTNTGEVIGQLALVRAAERGVGSEADKAKPFVVNLWAALAAVAPAAVPIAAVAGGALIGLVPVLATVALGVSGIRDEMKSGALEGTEYGRMMDSLEADAKKLQATAAQGILSGLDRGLAASHGLIGTVTQDVGDMSTQIGDIIAGGMPALLRILTQLNPLFVTFGNLITRGANELENWSEHSTGVSSFVAYVQAELPQVMAFLGNLVVLFSHLAQAAAPFGGVLLGELGLLVRVLNSIPVGVLQSAIPVAVSLYVALKAYQGVNAILAGVNSAVAGLRAPFVAAAATAQASSLAVQAASAEEAAVVARAKAAEALAAQEAAVEIAASVEGTSSILAGGASAAAEAAIEFAAAMQAEADAATAASVEIGAAATAAAETVAAEGKVAATGWTAALGPIAALGIGLTFLLGAFSSSSSKAEEAAKIQNSYADSLRKTTDALADVNIATTNKNLSDDHALAALDSLAKGNTDLKLTYNDLTLAVNGSEKQFGSVKDSLLALAEANKTALSPSEAAARGRGYVPQYNETGKAALDLLAKVKSLRDGLDGQTKTQIALNEANKQAAAYADGGTAEAAAQARALGVLPDAYLAAQVAAKKSAEQTRAQALAFRLANDGGSLLALTLDKLSGKKLGYQQALNSFQQQLTSGGPTGTGAGGNQAGVDNASNRHARAIEAEALAQQRYDNAVAKGASSTSIAAAHLALARAKDAVTASTSALTSAQQKNNGTLAAGANSVKGMTAAAVQNRGNILSLVTTAEAAAEAYGKLHNSTEAGRVRLKELRKELIDSRVAMGENRADVTKYVDSILPIPSAIAKANKTPFEIKTDAARAKVDALQARIDRIKQGKEPHLAANSVEANGVIDALQRKINRLEGKTVEVRVNTTIVGKHTEAGNAAAQQSYLDYLNSLAHKAAGGPVVGRGPKGVDSVPILGAPGEWVISDKAVDALTGQFGPAFMAGLNRGQVRLPAAASPAGAVGGAPTPASRTFRVDNLHLHSHYPEPEPEYTVAFPRMLRNAVDMVGSDF